MKRKYMKLKRNKAKKPYNTEERTENEEKEEHQKKEIKW
jgi:hypothetical protein